MHVYVSKGLPYKNKNGIITVWKNGIEYPLTLEQTFVWNFFHQAPNTKKDIEKYIKTNKKVNNVFINTVLPQTIFQLIGLDLISKEKSKGDIEDSLFTIFCKNKIKLTNYEPFFINENDIINVNGKKITLTNIQKKIYNYIRYCNDEYSLADIILELEDNQERFNYFTNGYDMEYINLARKSTYKKTILEFIKDMYNLGVFYIS